MAIDWTFLTRRLFSLPRGVTDVSNTVVCAVQLTGNVDKYSEFAVRLRVTKKHKKNNKTNKQKPKQKRPRKKEIVKNK